MTKMRIGLMGGTFDPVHYGHLGIADASWRALGLEQVIWLPAGDPPHKEAALAPQEHRYAMVKLATADHPQYHVSRLELERIGPSYSIDTLSHFRRERPEAELFFITGVDAVCDLLTWRRHEDVIRACRFIAVNRPGYDFSCLEERLPAAYLERIEKVTAPGLDVSSTEIRRRLRAGESIRSMVPEAVEAYIRAHGLYGARSDSPAPA